MQRPARSWSDRRPCLWLACALVAVMSCAGCVLFSLEPPCTRDDNCEGPRRCDPEQRVCVALDGGVVDDEGDAGG